MQWCRKEIHLLVCDDDPADRKLVKAYLKQAEWYEFRITEAGEEQEILAALDGRRFDLIFLDLQMPGKSGLEWLKELVAKDTAPVVMLTGQGSEAVAVEALKSGAYDYLPKALLSTPSLLRCITNALGKWDLQRQLRESEERFRLLAENARDIVYRIQLLPEKRVEYMSPATKAIVGYTPEDFYADPDFCFNLVHPEDRPICEGVLSGNIDYSKPVTLRWVAKDGRAVWMEQRKVPIFDDEGRLAAIEGIARDITERKETEEQLALYTQEIELHYVALEAVQQRINEDIEKARQLHQGFLPTVLPEVEGIAIGAHHQPAQNLGGDFYNVLRLGDQLLIYLVDVSGHGLDGALLAIFVRESINSFLFSNHTKGEPLSPAAILNHLAVRYLQEGFSEDYFVCVFASVLDLKTRCLSYSNAGSNVAPIFIHPGGEAASLTVSGLPISAAIDPDLLHYKEERLTFGPGATMLLTTDGLVEQYSEERMYGAERLREVFIKYHHLPPKQITHALIVDFGRFAGTLQGDDDITFVIIQSAPEETEVLAVEIGNGLEALERVEDGIRGHLADYVADTDLLILGLREMVANALEHGHRFDPEKKVRLRVLTAGNYIKLTVADEGPGFNWSDHVGREFDHVNFSERGRGIMITKMCYDQVYYNERGNEVTLIKKRAATSGAC